MAGNSEIFVLMIFQKPGTSLWPNLNLGNFVLIYLLFFIISLLKKLLKEIFNFLLNVWKACNFFYIPVLHLTLFFICNHKYSFSSWKKLSFSQKLFLFRKGCHSKNKQLLLSGFPKLIKPTLIQEALNK